MSSPSPRSALAFAAVAALLPRRVTAVSAPADTLTGRLVVGYQGWHGTNVSGGVSWFHWAENSGQPPSPTNVHVDVWPDMSE